MNTFLNRVLRGTAVFLALFFVLVAATPRASVAAPLEESDAARTSVSGTINGDTTWTAAGSPYQIAAFDSLIVAAGATLTIEPGVVVEAAEGARLQIAGGLEARGTAADPIRFKGATPAAGLWSGLIVWGPAADQQATAHLSHVVIEHGGREVTPTSAGIANLEAGNARITADHLTLRGGAGDGLLTHSAVSLSLRDAVIENNPGAALRVRSFKTKPELARIQAAGNGENVVALGGDVNIEGRDTWENAGLPYQLDNVMKVVTGAVLTIESGVTVLVAPNQAMNVSGTLLAEGTAAAPVTIRGKQQTPGSWQGINLNGDINQPPYLRLEHALVAHGGLAAGNDAVVRVDNGSVAISNSQISGGLGHGLYFFGNPSASVIENSRIVNNAGYGVFNAHAASGRILLAANNWWGAASGPDVDGSCNPGGSGARLSQGIAFQPFLTSANAQASAFAVPDAYLVSIEPQRWFAPANGKTPVYVDVTLVNGAGVPVPGQVVRLRSSIGTVVDGGITDVRGRTSAIVTSSAAGQASLIAEVGEQNAAECAFARSSAATVTFQSGAVDGLLASARAPYLQNGIDVSPLPVTRGVKTTIRGTLTNPNNFPITVEATLGFAQSGIGLAFGPLGAPQTKTIPANGSATFEVEWTPSVSGHYCVELTYTIVGSTANGHQAVQAGGSGQRNLQVYGGSMVQPATKNSIRQAQVAQTAVDDASFAVGVISDIFSAPVALMNGLMVGNILDFIYQGGGGIDCAMQGGTNCAGYQGPHLTLPGGTLGNILSDPPSQDYRRIITGEPLTFPPVTAGANMPAARAEALNALTRASLDTSQSLFLAVAAYDRYGGASEAGDLVWATQQSIAYLENLRDAAQHLLATADELENLIDVLEDEGISEVRIDAADFAAYQQRLQNQGWTQQEKDAAALVGLNDEALETRRQIVLAKDPQQVAGNVLDDWRTLAGHYREIGGGLAQTPGFADLPTGNQTNVAAADAPDLVRLYDTTAVIQVGNPLGQQATIDLRWRPVNLPPDWAVEISPRTLTLGAGEQAEVQVTIRPGTAAVEGADRSVAIEGYAGSQLLGGVMVEVNAPRSSAAPGGLFLPAVMSNQ